MPWLAPVLQADHAASAPIVPGSEEAIGPAVASGTQDFGDAHVTQPQPSASAAALPQEAIAPAMVNSTQDLEDAHATQPQPSVSAAALLHEAVAPAMANPEQDSGDAQATQLQPSAPAAALHETLRSYTRCILAPRFTVHGRSSKHCHKVFHPSVPLRTSLTEYTEVCPPLRARMKLFDLHDLPTFMMCGATRFAMCQTCAIFQVG